ncbi:cuticle protein 19-like [Penaeus japonicus]|uniref:cuticle protein 19-like n=1 Tax=Penaeus japonicus TaxID=27405 RepID=UPI001C70E267|nr:cuticle protein 19-like [Penaeus japonicus]
MIRTIAPILLLASLVLAKPTLVPTYGLPPPPVYPAAPPKYAFEYAVNDPYLGNHFGHSETRDGYRTDGEYFVHLPDGRLQTVSYYADETGYHPTVHYKGAAVYPAPSPPPPPPPPPPHPAPSPAYHPAPSPAYHRPLHGHH